MRLSAEERRQARALVWASVPVSILLGTEIVLLSVVGDESSDETQSRVFAVAGVIGDNAHWPAAVDAWNARTGGKVFHAAKCESEFANHPDRSKHKDNLALYRDLTQIIVKSELVGYGVALDLAAYNEHFPDVPKDAAYLKCLTDVVRFLTDIAEKSQSPIEYTFDQREQSNYNAGQLYDTLSRYPEWSANIFMRSKISFDTRENPRIQMADLIARETMKAMDNELLGRTPRGSMLALVESQRLRIDRHDRAYCADWLGDMERLEDESGFRYHEYADWLSCNKLADNFGNRYRYFNWVNHRDSLS